MGFGLVIGFIERLQNVTTNNYDSLTELRTSKITVTAAHIKPSQFAMSSSVVAWWRIPTVSSLPCSRSYRLATLSRLTRCFNCRFSSRSKSQIYVTTDGQSASMPWCQDPIWGPRPDFCFCQRVAGSLMWGALSDERTGLSLTIAAGPRQRSHSRVRVPRDSWPYFTVSDSRHS
jgi:hypothetical protein